MLSLNSYGLPRISSNNNVSECGGSRSGFTLPRLHVGSPHARTSALSPFSPAPPRETRSLTKLEMMRRSEHPMYRTTTGYEYGRHLEIPDSALSAPKHARHAGFTHEFIAGPFQDNNLLSIAKSQQRAESWQRKVEERTKQMKIKYDELQEKLEVKKHERRRERESRRRGQQLRHRAATLIQAHARGFLVRSELERDCFVRHTAAAGRIQQVFRSREQVKHAKRELHARRLQRLDGFATKLQTACRRFLLRRSAMRRLESLRRARWQTTAKGSERRLQQQPLTEDEASAIIQRAMRQRFGRRVRRNHSVRSTTSTTPSTESKDSDGSATGAGSGGSNSARSKQSQRLARRTIVSLKQRKKSLHRL